MHINVHLVSVKYVNPDIIRSRSLLLIMSLFCTVTFFRLDFKGLNEKSSNLKINLILTIFQFVEYVN